MTRQAPNQQQYGDGGVLDFRLCSPVGSIGAVLVIPLVVNPTIANPTEASWQPGVLQIALPAVDHLKDRTTDSTTNRRARSADMAAGPELLLHQQILGRPMSGRWHLIHDSMRFESLQMFAAEFISGAALGSDESARHGLLAIHFSEIHKGRESLEERASAVANTVRVLSFWAPVIQENDREDLQRKFFDFVESVMPIGWALPPHRCRALSLTHMPADAGLAPSATDELLYSLVSGTDLRRKRPTPERLSSLDIVEKPGAWRCVVMRDGMACSVPTDAEAERIRIYFHTIFLDPLLLGQLQIDAVTLLQKDFLFQDMSKVEPLLALELQVFNFRRRVWSDHLTSKKTSPRDQLLRAFQRQYALNAEVQALTEDVVDSSRLVSTIQAQELRESQERTQSLIQYLTALFVPLGLTYTAAAVLNDPAPAIFVGSTIIGVLLTAAASWSVWMLHKRSAEQKVKSPRDR